MGPTLVVLAAGMGSRYGGLKQLEAVGPGGEFILDYSVFDALRVGFEKVVFVIRRDIESLFREKVGSRFEGRIPVEYAFQDLDSLPAAYTVPVGRTKPWGTGHAVLAARSFVKEPFAVINADDFYGRDAFAVLGKYLSRMQTNARTHALVGFTLENTLSESGGVSRGICSVGENHFLRKIAETTEIRREGDRLTGTAPGGKTVSLTGQETVSMNLWGFSPLFLWDLEREFHAFLKKHHGDSKAEFYLPSAVNALLERKEAEVIVLATDSQWFGVTYPDDKKAVSAGIRELVRTGEYPGRLQFSP